MRALGPAVGAGRDRLGGVDLERWTAAAGDLLLGASCHGCGVAWWGVCPRCRALVASRRPYATQPDPTPSGFPPTVTSAAYDDVLRNLIVAHKDRQALTLSRYLAERLASSVHALLSASAGATGDRVVTLVPVPSAAAAVRRRGFDATWTMARLAARRLRVRHRVGARRLIEQRRGILDQAGLDAGQRAANLDHGFRLRARVVPLRGEVARSEVLVVLVDDVVTTGASLTEAARVLGQAGIAVLGAATVAATVRRRPGPVPRIGVD